MADALEAIEEERLELDTETSVEVEPAAEVGASFTGLTVIE